MSDQFQALGSAVAESLLDTHWKAARVEFTWVEQGVVDYQASYESSQTGSRLDFDLVDPIGAVVAFEALRSALAAKGHPAMKGLVLLLERSGKFEVDYKY